MIQNCAEISHATNVQIMQFNTLTQCLSGLANRKLCNKFQTPFTQKPGPPEF